MLLLERKGETGVGRRHRNRSPFSCAASIFPTSNLSPLPNHNEAEAGGWPGPRAPADEGTKEKSKPAFPRWALLRRAGANGAHLEKPQGCGTQDRSLRKLPDSRADHWKPWLMTIEFDVVIGASEFVTREV